MRRLVSFGEERRLVSEEARLVSDEADELVSDLVSTSLVSTSQDHTYHHTYHHTQNKPSSPSTNGFRGKAFRVRIRRFASRFQWLTRA